MLKFDYIIVGSGLAGLYAAYKASMKGSVAVITKSIIRESNSFNAQGGIAAVTADDDNPEIHKSDTLIAGRGLCEESAVDILDYCGQSAAQEFIVVTESGILAEMRKRYPHKTFIPAPAVGSEGGCNQCSYMKMVTLENILECLENEAPEVHIDEQTRKAAELSILNMVAIKYKEFCL